MMVYYNDEEEDMLHILPIPYQEWSANFNQEKITTLLEHSRFNYKIDLLSNTTPFFGSFYSCSTFELK